MNALLVCSACGGFVPPTLTACPHCAAGIARAPVGRRRGAGWVARRAAVAGFSMTLMACYGGGPNDGMYYTDAYCEPGPADAAPACETDACPPAADASTVPRCAPQPGIAADAAP
jgi:hypothetical protein